MVFNFASDDPILMIKILKTKFPDYQLDGHVVSGNVNIFEWRTIFTILHMTLPVSPVYSIIIWVRMKIIQILDRHQMSENTKILHKQLLSVGAF